MQIEFKDLKASCKYLESDLEDEYCINFKNKKCAKYNSCNEELCPLNITMDYFHRHIKSVKMPIITIYEKPSDFPDKFVARLWDMQKPTVVMVLADTLDQIRNTIPSHMVLMPRSINDDFTIVESYI